MIKKYLISLTLLSLAMTIAADECPQKPLTVERLASLNIPRTGHTIFRAREEIVVAGGHTSGFVPTPTAEYYADGQWHLIPTVYTHDFGFSVPMQSGRVLLAGGAEKELGIGQTFTVEFYDPSTHSFKGNGALDTKRCFASGMELDSGHVIVTGNWYTDDALECYNGQLLFSPLKKTTQHRFMPYILRTSADNAIIFSSLSNRNTPIDTIIVDRLVGDAYSEPLLNEWHPLQTTDFNNSTDYFIGNTLEGNYSYLLPALNGEGQIGILRTRGEQIELLPTQCPIPRESKWEPIGYNTALVADTLAHRAYLTGYGTGNDRRIYVVSIYYDVTPAIVTLHYSEPQDSVSRYQPILTAEGNLLMAGGFTDSNFDPTASVLLLRLGNQPLAEATATAGSSLWPWIVALVVAAVIATGLWYAARHRRRQAPLLSEEQAESADDSLMTSICQLMEREKLYLNAELKVADVAKALGTNSTYVSRSVNLKRNCTFTQFVNGYRISHAQRLLRQQPDMKISAVSATSGFANETSFFRAFKAVTGMTPKEWIAKSTDNS